MKIRVVFGICVLVAALGACAKKDKSSIENTEPVDDFDTEYEDEPTDDLDFQEDIDDPEITTITSDNSTNDLSEVTKIVIWAFNAPKTYNFEAHFTPANNE